MIGGSTHLTPFVGGPQHKAEEEAKLAADHPIEVCFFPHYLVKYVPNTL